MLINIIHKDSLPDSTSTTYHMWASLSDILFSSILEKYIVCDVCGLRTPHLSLVVCYIFHLLIPLLCKTWFYKDCNTNCKNPVLDVIRTLGTANQAIYYNLLNIYVSSLIDLDTLIIGFIFTTEIFLIFSSTPVLTSSKDVVFVLSLSQNKVLWQRKLRL